MLRRSHSNARYAAVAWPPLSDWQHVHGIILGWKECHRYIRCDLPPHQGMCIYIASVVIRLNASPPHVFLDDGCAIHYVPSDSPTRSIESQWRRLTRHRGEERFIPRVSSIKVYSYSWPTLRSRAESLSQQCQICCRCMAAIVRLAACTRNHPRLERMPSLHQVRPASPPRHVYIHCLCCDSPQRITPHVFLDNGCAIHYVPSDSPTRSIESQWRRLTRHRAGEERFSPRVS